MKSEDDKIDKEIEKSFGGSRLSFWLFIASWFFLLCLPLSFFSKIQDYDPQTKAVVSSRWAWEWTVVCTIAWFCMAFCSFFLAKRGKKGRILNTSNKNA